MKPCYTHSYTSDLPKKEKDFFHLSAFPLLDETIGLKAVSNHKPLLIRALNLLQEQSLPADLRALQEAHTLENWEHAQEVAHKIKGGCSYVGAIRMKIACQYFERYWKIGGRDLLEQLYQQMIDTIDESMIEIKAWLTQNQNKQP